MNSKYLIFTSDDTYKNYLVVGGSPIVNWTGTKDLATQFTADDVDLLIGILSKYSGVTFDCETVTIGYIIRSKKLYYAGRYLDFAKGTYKGSHSSKDISKWINDKEQAKRFETKEEAEEFAAALSIVSCYQSKMEVEEV